MNANQACPNVTCHQDDLAHGDSWYLSFVGVGCRCRFLHPTTTTTTANTINTPVESTTPIDTIISLDNDDTDTNSPDSDTNICTNTDILPFRLDVAEIHVGEAIAMGDTTVVYVGHYASRVVAIKRLQPAIVHNTAVVRAFTDDIRLRASVAHPKILAFVGVAWSTPQDLSVVTEFLSGGDLHSLLLMQPTPPPPTHWVEQWATSYIQPKSTLALDVAEALASLYSLEARVLLYGNIQARCILLDSRGHAKLGDLGSSGPVAGVSTAPEVLRGDRYTEKADVYSFGVLLVELEQCRHPSAGLLDANKLAVLDVDRLRPSVSPECPEVIRELVHRCLSPDPEDRPDSSYIAEELRQLQTADAVFRRSMDTVYFRPWPAVLIGSHESNGSQITVA